MELLTKGKMIFDQKRLRLFFFFFLVINMGTAFSFQIYVSPSGKNNNPGTMEEPLASLSAARDLARSIRKGQALAEPIEIIIASGSYNLLKPLALTAEDSGTDEAPLVFRGKKALRLFFQEVWSYQHLKKCRNDCGKNRILAYSQG